MYTGPFTNDDLKIQDFVEIALDHAAVTWYLCESFSPPQFIEISEAEVSDHNRDIVCREYQPCQSMINRVTASVYHFCLTMEWPDDLWNGCSKCYVCRQQRIVRWECHQRIIDAVHRVARSIRYGHFDQSEYEQELALEAFRKYGGCGC